MTRRPRSRGSAQTLALVIPVVIVLLPLGYSLLTSLLGGGEPEDGVFLEKPDPRYEECVRPATWMRYHHWTHLRKVREEVVRYGKRGDAGLNRCKDCHTSRLRFCGRCHVAAGVNPDCWDCHDYPD